MDEDVKTPVVPEIKATAPDVGIDMQGEIKAALEKERARITEVAKICAGNADMQAKAVNSGWTPEKTGLEMLYVLRDTRPTAPNIIVAKEKTQSETKKMLEASLRMQTGFSCDDLIKDYGEKTVEAADRSRCTLQDVMKRCCEIENIAIPSGFGNDTIRASFSSISLTNILSNVANKAMLKAYRDYPVVSRQLCNAGNLVDFKEYTNVRMYDKGDLLELPADGQIQDGGLGEEVSKNQLATYAKKITVTRQMMINNDLNTFDRMLRNFGSRAARKIDQLFFTRLLANPTMEDSNALFSTAHSNYLTGSTTAFDAEALRTAIQMFREQVDGDSQPLSIDPVYLLVPPDLEFPAIRETNSQTRIITGGDTLAGVVTAQGELNAVSRLGLQVIQSPYLSNSSYTGYSALAYYLFASPSIVDTFEIGYLKGMQRPTLERGNTDYNTLGIWWRVYFDLGIREQDWRGIVKMKGEA